MAPILNYTTTVTVARTRAEIEGMLTEAGASEVATTYDEKTRQPNGLRFSILTEFGIHEFRLPINPTAIDTFLKRGRKRYITAVQEKAIAAQAERVAWRITKDWLEVQLALIAVGMVTIDQVMMPYRTVDDAGWTVYDAYRESQLKLAAPKQVRNDRA